MKKGFWQDFTNLSEMKWIRGRYSFLPIVLINTFILTVAIYLGDKISVFSITREKAIDMQKEMLSDFLSLLGVGLAVLAVLLAIIQFSYKRLNIIKLVIDHTYFAPLVYFGLFNVIICALNFLLHNDCKAWPDRMFNRIAVTETYLFVVFVICLAIVFYRTFLYSNFSLITDLYIGNIRRLVVAEKLDNVDDDGAEFLQTAASELKAEVDASLDESRVTVIDKIFDLYLYVQRKNPQSNILRGLKIFLQSWIVNAYRKNNIIILHKLVEKWGAMYKHAIASGDRNTIGVLKYFASEFYNSTANTDVELNRKIVIDFFPIRLKEFGWIQVMNAKPGDGDFKELVDAYKSVDNILEEFSELIKSTIEAYDIRGLQGCLQELKNLYGDFAMESSYEDTKFNIRFAKQGVPGFNRLDEGVRKRFDLYEQLLFDRQTVVFGNLAWLYYLILEGKKEFDNNKKSIDVLLRYLNLSNEDFLPLASGVIRKRPEGYNWDKWIWNSEERLSGETYFLQNEEVFLAIGLIAKFIKNGIDSVPISTFEAELAIELQSTIYWIKDVIKNYGYKKKEWSLILDIPEDDVAAMLSKVQDYFMEFEGVRVHIEQAELASAVLSDKKIESFRSKIFDQWNKSNTLTRIFEYFDSVERVPNLDGVPDISFMHVGMMRINFEKAKFLFTDVQHREIHGLEWGYQVNRQVAAFFIEQVKSLVKENIAKNYLEILDNIPSNIDQNENGQIIMLHFFGSSYTVLRQLEGSGSFKTAQQFGEDGYPFDFTGVYRNKVLLVPVSSEKFKNRVVLLRLPGTINLKRRIQKDWMGDVLQVDVINIDEKNARQLFERKYPDKEITQNILNEILSGVFIEINETLKFEIKNVDQIALYHLTNAKDSDDD